MQDVGITVYGLYSFRACHRIRIRIRVVLDSFRLKALGFRISCRTCAQLGWEFLRFEVYGLGFGVWGLEFGV